MTMTLVGMLDSPYVRRVAVALQLLDLPFRHRALSVFRHYDKFKAVSPVVKAPTLVCDDDVTLLDSTLIVRYAESLAGRSLLSATALQRDLRLLGLALAACEKAVQRLYERNRPADRQHQPWVDRIALQMDAALAALEAEAAPLEPDTEPGITAAVTWRFISATDPPLVDPAAYPRLAALSARAEALPAYAAAPHGDSQMPDPRP